METMLGLVVLTGVVAAGVLIGFWRSRRNHQDVPNPFQRVVRK